VSTKLKWEHCFPFGQIRDQQRIAIEFALENFVINDKRFVVIESPVGSGKSAIAMTIANYFRQMSKRSYVLTTQKILQEQYVKDFGQTGLIQLKSSASYSCKKHDSDVKPLSCSDVKKLLRAKPDTKSFYKECCGDECRYAQAKATFIESEQSITNYAYFLVTNAHSYQKMPFRDLLILDECHNIEASVSAFVEVSFSNKFYKNVLNVKMPPVAASQDVVHKWLTVTCWKKLRNLIATKKEAHGAHAKSSEVALALAAEIEDLEKHFKKLDFFKRVYDSREWVLDISRTDQRGERIYEFKPLDVSRHARELLFDYCDKTLLLSATIIDIDSFCLSVGIKKDEVAYLRLPSTFPIENRRVHVMPVGSMSRKNFDETMPMMVRLIKEILRQHSSDKGIIHATTFKIAQYLNQHLQDERVLVHDSSNRNEVLRFHLTVREPTVLLSPSMTEGVDLAGDKSRFQIICKIPYPYIGDVVVASKMQTQPAWYEYQTAKTIIQALGRSVRNERDFAASYILDSDWLRFYAKNSHMFPPDFDSTIVK
jgi:Rad3-related DNA helicase